MISSRNADAGIDGTRAVKSNPVSTIFKIALLLVQCAVIAGGFLWLPPATGFMNPPLARIVVFHVPCSIVATIASIVATWYAIAYLRTRNWSDDIKSRVSFGFGLLFWILTTVTGAFFAKVQWGGYWNWDIKQTSMLMLLLINIAYFALRSAIENPNKQAAIAAAYAIFAMAAVPTLTYVLPNSTPDTLHPKGVITTKEGLATSYKIVLWTGVLCLTSVYVWGLRIQVRIEQLAMQTRRRSSTKAAPKVVITEMGQ
jgi:heme exporter protein C